MKIAKKIFDKAKDKHNNKTPTIVFFGDSVTQGCFELGFEVGQINTDAESVYHNIFKKMIYAVCPDTVVNIINSGIGGDTTEGGIKRLERDVLCYNPDLCVVCFGLNDSSQTDKTEKDYAKNLKYIFESIKKTGSEVIFMTHNMMNTYVSDIFPEGELKNYAEFTCKNQNDGQIDRYVNAAIETANECGITVCDCYAKWKKLYENGADITKLLANGINHPNRSMHNLFAYSLFDIVFFKE